jgi:hypothetical protein
MPYNSSKPDKKIYILASLSHKMATPFPNKNACHKCYQIRKRSKTILLEKACHRLQKSLLKNYKENNNQPNNHENCGRKGIACKARED